MKFEKSTDELLYQMQNDKDVLGRRWAMAELANKAKAGTDKERIVAAFEASAEKDPFWRIRRAAVSVVADIFSPDPPRGQERVTPILEDATVQVMRRLAAKDPQSLIRGDAIRLLGETKDPKYVDLYLSALNDQSYNVIDNAAGALALTKDARAYDALVKLTNTQSWKGRIQSAGLEALSELGDKRALDLGLKTATDKTVSPHLRALAFEIVAAVGKGDPRAYPLIFEQFKKAFDAGDERGILNGVQSLITLADPRGQEAFDMLKVKYKDDADVLQTIKLFETQFKSAVKP